MHHEFILSSLFFTFLIGSIELNLNGMPNAKKKAKSVSLKMLPDESKKEVDMISLFEAKRIKGWWPVISEESGEREITVSLDRDTIYSWIHG